MDADPPLIFLVGPTASGKSSLAVALAERLPLELISMDSAQVYRSLDIGTAKPTLAVRQRCPHHLIDIRDPAQAYSAAQFAEDAATVARDIHARGRWPLVVGGTFLYMRALLRGLHVLPAADPELRRQLDEEAAVQGWPRLHQRLLQLDAGAAARIHPNDSQRISRALEIALRGPVNQSRRFSAESPSGWQGAALQLALLPEDRVGLRQQIAARFVQMLDEGLLAEVRQLYEQPDLRPELPALRSVGYRQLWQHLAGHCSLDEATQKAITATRQYAKRQLTWLRSETELTVLPQAQEQRLEAAINAITPFMDQYRT